MKEFFTPYTLPIDDTAAIDIQVQEGIDFILTHISGPTFPRNISTAASHGGQFPVFSMEEMVDKFRRANYIDCRINAYPMYTGYKGINRQTPDFIFIDLDKSTFSGGDVDALLKKALDATLRMIKRELGGGVPTVLWTGNGYHIYIPLQQNLIFEQIKEFEDLDKQPSLKFMRFAERWLSKSKSDPAHNPSYRSCLIRVPGTYNSKYMKKNGIPRESAQVRIIQKWDGQRMPISNHMLLEFYHSLVEEKVTEIRQSKKNRMRNVDEGITNSSSDTIPWIEKLIQTPIAEYRKNAVRMILAPYLVNIRKMSEADAIIVINRWLDECNKLRQLDSELKSSRVKSSVRYAMSKGLKPLKFSTLKERNYQLYSLLRQSLQ